MAVPLLGKKIVKKRVKKFKRTQSDRYVSLKKSLTVYLPKRGKKLLRAAQLDVVVTNKLARLRSREDE